MKYWEDAFDDESASDYMRSYGEGPGCETRLSLGSFINDGETVLDVGCGPGWNLDHFLQFGPQVKDYLGLDYSERFVRVANQRHPGKYQLGDVRDIRQPERSWDVVIMQDVLEHTNGYETPVREALRVARKRVIVSFWHLIEADEHINDDGDDTWGAWYERKPWEDFLDSLDVHWLHEQIEFPVGRQRDFYIIDLGEEHGKGAATTTDNGRGHTQTATTGGQE